MEIRPILSSLLRNKTGALLIAAQVALSLAIVANALYIIKDRMDRVARPSGVSDESTQITSAATHGTPFSRVRDRAAENGSWLSRAML